ncbi:histone H1-I-like isoform X2 [Schistocerca gregaria]|uniref:histone H1-I-like isoform X2 n=1 Tax=Schistocerca gregaria TaxID=7010 RepID=UPI00211DF5F0|nr:histone H1-I-like isoform X2 [Schistocerca gregaria]
MEKSWGSVTTAAGSGAEQEQRCRQQMQRAGELCKRLLRRLDVAGASLRRALDGCRRGLERLEDDNRQRQQQGAGRQPGEEQLQAQPAAVAPPKPPPLKTRARPQTPPPKQKTPPQARHSKPTRRALTQIQLKQVPLQKQPSPPVPAKVAARTGARATRDVPARKNEKGKTSPTLLEQKPAIKVQPKKPNWKKFVPKPCKKGLGD